MIPSRRDWSPSLARWFAVRPWEMEDFTATEVQAMVAEAARLDMRDAARGE